MSFDSIDRIIDGDMNNMQNKETAQISLNEEYLNDFLVETKEHLESIEMSILALEKDNNNKEIIDSAFRDFHTIKGLAGFVSQSLVQKIAHQTESVLDRCRKDEIVITANLIQFILKSTDYIKNVCENLKLNEDKNFINNVYKHINQLENFDDTVISQKSAAPPDLTNKNIDTIIDNIIGGEKTLTATPEKQKKDLAYVRIPIQKIDTLIDIIGELVINHSQFEQQAHSMINSNDRLSESLHRVSGLTKDIQNLSVSLRMVSLKSVFQRIYRIGKDTVSTLGKNAVISLNGEETEIDRGVVEKLVDPLVHLIKNSIYHGIEDEANRIKNGKSPMGHVKLEAYSKKGSVYIVISDDGRGIDPKSVLQKAISKGFADVSTDYSEDEILNFAFLPGLSTLAKADDISGRGVGLDVVKTQITKMGGKIEIKNNVGNGCSFILKMPINMAIINGTIVDIAGTEYIVPSLSINTIFKPNAQQWVSAKGIKNMIKLRGNVIPLINIEKVLDIKNFDRQNCILVVLESEQKLKALPITRMIENKDIIIKTLGVDFDNLTYAFGASILGNGKIAIIFDVENLFQKGD